MISFGTTKHKPIAKKIDEYDKVCFSPDYTQFVTFKDRNFVSMDGTFLYGMFYIKVANNVVRDKAIFEAKFYDPLYYIQVLKESGHMGCLVKVHEDYFPQFLSDFNKTLENVSGERKWWM